MDIQEALAYIDGTQWFGSKPGLSRTEALLEKLGRPQDGLKFVHIAGTNGKGSCAAMLASVLRAAGYRTGLYTSPYLFRFHERMQVNGEQISDGELAELVTRLRPLAEAMADHHTEFELITAAALRWFADRRCDIVVLEVGLGGRLDATNVIAAPEAAVLMNIGLDHTAVLGDTLEQIAAEKAGILKPGCEAVAYQQRESVREVFRRKAREVGAGLRVADFSRLEPEFDSLEGQSFLYKGEPYALSLLGEHQLRNAAVVLETVELLRARGWRISHEAVEYGLYAAV
ncbi:MAG: bifunctional folylpolyglutamate synthase/dihydrofolate synthase, partial [Clostridia bacterium]|nr:bifunctional folylpolyglutamate synthase/dihydrofolate synthase [Clostridia bacterium]